MLSQAKKLLLPQMKKTMIASYRNISIFSKKKNFTKIEIQQGCVKNLIHIDKSIKNLPRKHFWRVFNYINYDITTF